VEIARVGRKPGVPAPILFLAGVIPCTGPWRYHPGRGRGGSPLPAKENHTGPSPELPRRSGGYRGDGPGRAQARGAGPDPVPRRRHPMYRTVEISPGEGPGRGRGGNPLPVGKNHTGPSPEPPRRSGGYRGDSPGGAQARGAGPDPALRRHHPIHRTVEVSPGEGPGRGRGGAGEGTPSPSKRTIPALPQSPRAGAGALVVMAREGRPRVPAQILPFPGVIPCTGLWRYHPGRGRGGAGEGTPSPSGRTIQALPQSPRAGAGDVVEITRVGPTWGAGPDPVPRRHHPMHRIVGVSPGRGRGGNPLPVGKNHTGPSPAPPRRSGSSRGDGPGGAQARGAGLDPVPRRRQPMHRTVEVSPGEGPGREPPPRRREPYRPFPGAPAQERELSW